MKINKLRQLRGYLGFCGLDNTLHQLASETETRRCQRIFQNLMPSHITDDCTLLLFRNQELCIYSAKPEWTSWLRNRQSRIKQQFQDEDAKVASIRIVTAPRSACGIAPEIDKPLAPPSIAPQVVEESARSIDDPALKNSMLRLAKRLSEKQRNNTH
jgi:hypothetical protein